MNDSKMKVGECTVWPALNAIERGGRTFRIQPRAMDLLVFLAERPGRVISTQELIADVWQGSVVVDHAVYRIIQQLRDALGDDAERPEYIQTIRRRGYRLIAPVALQTRDRVPNVEQHSQMRTETPALAWVAGVIGIVALIGSLLWLQSDQPENRTNLSDRPQLLITEATGQTDDEMLSIGLSAELAREFGGSSRFVIASSARISETLALMREPSTNLTPEIWRAVAARDESLMLVLESRIQSVGPTSRVRVTLLEPHSSSVLVVEELVIDAASDIDAQLARLAQRLRDRVETLETEIPFSPLERVTTNSLEAVRIYSEAMTLSLLPSAPNRHETIIELTRAALALDPLFASAEILLAHYLNNAGTYPPELFRSHADQALANAGHASTEEALFIRGSYEMLNDDFAQAIEPLARLVELNPSHYWGVNNLAVSFARTGDQQRAAQYRAAQSDLIPTRADLAVNAASSLTDIDQHELAGQYWERARLLSTSPDISPEHRSLVAAFYANDLMDRAYRSWTEGRYGTQLDELARLQEELSQLTLDERSNLASAIAGSFLSLGRTADAEAVLLQHNDPARYPQAHLIEFATGQPWPVPSEGPITRRPDGTTQINRGAAFALARRGVLDDVESLLQAVRDQRRTLEADDTRDRFDFRALVVSELALVEAELLRATGDNSLADELAGEALAEIAASERSILFGAPVAFLSAETLASRLAARGEIDRAIETLENWGGRRGRSEISPHIAVFWMRGRLKLSELLEDRDPARAAELRQELAQLLEFADDDHFVAREVRGP